MITTTQWSRRVVLTAAVALGAAGCGAGLEPSNNERSSVAATSEQGRVLLAYFSRAGENYYYGGRRDLEVGNTHVLAEMIADLIGVDVYRIEAADPYSTSYDATVQRNVTEQDADARPEITDPLASIDGYTHVLLGSPIWNVRPPMIMSTFAEAFDFTGVTVHPFVTYAVSGLGSTERVYTQTCRGADIAPGLAVLGEEVTQGRADVQTWLRAAGLLD